MYFPAGRFVSKSSILPVRPVFLLSLFRLRSPTFLPSSSLPSRITSDLITFVQAGLMSRPLRFSLWFSSDLDVCTRLFPSRPVGTPKHVARATPGEKDPRCNGTMENPWNDPIRKLSNCDRLSAGQGTHGQSDCESIRNASRVSQGNLSLRNSQQPVHTLAFSTSKGNRNAKVVGGCSSIVTMSIRTNAAKIRFTSLHLDDASKQILSSLPCYGRSSDALLVREAIRTR